MQIDLDYAKTQCPSRCERITSFDTSKNAEPLYKEKEKPTSLSHKGDSQNHVGQIKVDHKRTPELEDREKDGKMWSSGNDTNTQS